MAYKPPRRKRKSDRLIVPGASATQIRCDFILAPFDEASRIMDRKWGVNRLPELVSVETAEKFGMAMSHLNEMIDLEDTDKLTVAVKNAIKGMAVMDKEAEDAGKPQARSEVLEYDLEGFRFGILPDAAQWPSAQAERPDLRLFTLREIAVALKAMKTDFHLIDTIKQQFAPAEITAIRDKLPKSFYDAGGDEIPW